MQPAEVQASRVKVYVVHGSKRRKRKFRDSPLNSRFPSLYKLYIWKARRKAEKGKVIQSKRGGGEEKNEYYTGRLKEDIAKTVERQI